MVDESGRLSGEVRWPEPHSIGQAEEQAVLAALRGGAWSAGSLVKEFEQEFANFCGVRFAILTSSGTAALKIALLALQLKPGDEVIIPAMTWPSVVIAVLESGGRPVIADIDPDTCGISVGSVAKLLSPRTKVIIPAHLFCSQADTPALARLILKSAVRIVEDVSHACGSVRMSRLLGTYGDAAFFSFNHKKVLSSGEGGCLITNSEALYQDALPLRTVDLDAGALPNRLPIACPPTELQAKLLTAQLSNLPKKIREIERRGERLRREIENVADVSVLRRLPGTEVQTYYNFCFRVEGLVDMIGFRRKLGGLLGLTVKGGYPPVTECQLFNINDPRFPGLSHGIPGDCPRARWAHEKELVRFHYQGLLHQDGPEIIANAVERTIDEFR